MLSNASSFCQRHLLYFLTVWNFTYRVVDLRQLCLTLKETGFFLNSEFTKGTEHTSRTENVSI